MCCLIDFILTLHILRSSNWIFKSLVTVVSVCVFVKHTYRNHLKYVILSYTAINLLMFLLKCVGPFNIGRKKRLPQDTRFFINSNQVVIIVVVIVVVVIIVVVIIVVVIIVIVIIVIVIIVIVIIVIWQLWVYPGQWLPFAQTSKWIPVKMYPNQNVSQSKCILGQSFPFAHTSKCISRTETIQ